jgi:hypothetical protein
MRTKMKAFFLPALMFCAVCAAGADFPAFFSVDVENDAGFKDFDRSYTNGIRINLGNALSPFVEKYFENLEKLIGTSKDDAFLRNYLLYMATNMYTPKEDNREYTYPIPDDRPYAGWTRLGLAVTGIRKNWIETLDVSAGALGDAGDGALQTIWHDLFHIPPFEGWQNHVKERIAFQLSYSSNGKLCRDSYPFDEDISFFDAWAWMKLDVGNVFMRVSPGIIATLGYFRDPKFWLERKKEDMKGMCGVELRVFAALRGNVTAYNGTLDAQTGVDYVISNLPVTLDARGGVSFNVFHSIPCLPSVYIELSVNAEMTDYAVDHYINIEHPIHPFWKAYVEIYCSNTGPHGPGNDYRQLD